MPSAPTYDLWQQTFVMSMCASKLFGVQATSGTQNPQSTLQSHLAAAIAPYAAPAGGTTDPAISPYIGNWTLAWGPQVWMWPGNPPTSPPSTVSDNSMFVANQTGTDNYVIAIGATTALSEYDWTNEDLWVVDVVDWKSFCANPTPVKAKPAIGDAVISMGTANGLYQLLQMSDPTTSQTLLTFLGTLPSTAQIIVTGHSLGGALAPALAMYYNDTGAFGRFSNKPWVYPTAGATPGNEWFAGKFNSAFEQQSGGGAWQYWNTMLWNTMDVVPHAWSLAGNAPIINQINTLYGSAPADITAVVALAETASAASEVIYTHTQNSPLSGTPASGNSDFGPLVVPPTTDKEFMTQAGFQHMDGYFGSSLGPGLIIPQMPQPSQPVPLPAGLATISLPSALDTILGWVWDALKALVPSKV